MSNRTTRIYEFGPFRLDVAERLLMRSGAPVPLTPKVFDTLLVLIENSGHLVGKDELMKKLWPDTFVEEVTLARNISDLRKALGEVSNGRKYVDTVPKRGYRFAATVAEVGEAGELIVERATRSRLIIDEEETITADENEQALASRLKAANAMAHNNELPISGRETNPLAKNPSFSFNRAPLKARPRSMRYLLVAGALVVLPIAAFVLPRLLGKQRVTTVSGTHGLNFTFKRLTYDSKSDSPAISADGKLLAYVVTDKNQSSIWLKNLANDSAVQVMPPIGKSLGALAFSPDGNQIYYLTWRLGDAPGTCCRLPVLGGTSQSIAKDISSSFALSPDGKQIVFIRSPLAGQNELVIANVDGTGEREILRSSPAIRIWPWGAKPAWSPDGRKVAICAWREDGRCVLLEVGIGDTDISEVPTPTWNYVEEILWLADDRGFMLTAREKQEAPLQIWELGPGAEARRLTNDVNAYTAINMTADAHTLVASQFIDATHLWIAPDGDSSRAKPLTSGINRNDGFNGLSWTPDRKIVFASTANDVSDIWVMEADGGGRQQLTADTGSNFSPRITPNGRYIVLVSNRTGENRIWRLDMDGNNPRQLTDGENDSAPAVSSDGLWVYYLSYRSDPPISLRKVSIDGGMSVSVPAMPDIDRPALSPDGQLIVYEYRGNPACLAVAPVDSGVLLKRFENLHAYRGLARFTPDSKSLIYSVNGNNIGNLWLQSLAGGQPRQLTHFNEGFIVNFALSADGHDFVLSRTQQYKDVVLFTDFK